MPALIVTYHAEPKKWKALVSTALAAAVITFSYDMPALSDLNKFEADIRGEFGIGSAAQFGSADLRCVIVPLDDTMCVCARSFFFFFFKLSRGVKSNCKFICMQEGCSYK